MTKDELRQYRYIKLELEQLDRDRERLYTLLERCVKAPSHAPGYGGMHDPYPMIMDKLDEVRAKTDARARELLDMRVRIEAAIGALDGREQYIMRARYVEGRRPVPWAAIAMALYISEDRVKHIHGGILLKIKDSTSQHLSLW